MRTLGAEDIASLLPMPDAIDVAARALRAMAVQDGVYPSRVHVPLQSGDVLVMPGYDGHSHFGVKVVTVHPGNAARGMPGTRATYLLTGADDGEPELLCDGTALTALRTGAASGVATRRLASTDARVLAIIGAGGQARAQAEAVCAVRPIAEIDVVNRDDARADAFIAFLRRRYPHVRSARAHAQAAVARADVVVTATTSTEPVVAADWVRPGTHINAIGSFRPDMIELDPALVARATVYVDLRASALKGAGEIIAAVDRGLVSPDALIDLGEVPENARKSRDEITLFKTVGHAALDLFTAVELLHRAAGVSASGTVPGRT